MNDLSKKIHIKLPGPNPAHPSSQGLVAVGSYKEGKMILLCQHHRQIEPEITCGYPVEKCGVKFDPPYECLRCQPDRLTQLETRVKKLEERLGPA